MASESSSVDPAATEWLGRDVPFSDQYDPSLLRAIARQPARAQLAFAPMLHGLDRLTAYEVSWLDARGQPQTCVLEISIPCTSSHFVESKSLKLYLGSLQMSCYASRQQIVDTVAGDLSRCCGSAVGVQALALSELASLARALPGECLDDIAVGDPRYHRDASVLTVQSVRLVCEQLFSHVFRSVCPVTGQPDAGTVWMSYEGPQIDRQSLLRYLISYRLDASFHEHAIEQIVADVVSQCGPRSVTVVGLFCRRGGIDITPVRGTAPLLAGDWPRGVRQ